jgi:hypothetical protein
MTRLVIFVIFALSGFGFTVSQGLAGEPAVPAEPLFSRHVVPIFSKLGCNAGACHGAVQGQNGFRLSLFGMEPALDHDRLLRDTGGRRINSFDPDSSLLLLKATGQSTHRGGMRTTPGSADYRILRNWLTQGAKLDAVEKSLVNRLAVFPQEKLGPTTFQDVTNALVHQQPLGRIRMAIRRHLDCSQMTRELFGMGTVELHGTFLKELQQMIGGRAIAADGLDGRPEDLLVMLQPAVA